MSGLDHNEIRANIQELRAVSHRAITEGVNLKYVQKMREALYASADTQDALLGEVARLEADAAQRKRLTEENAAITLKRFAEFRERLRVVEQERDTNRALYEDAAQHRDDAYADRLRLQTQLQAAEAVCDQLREALERAVAREVLIGKGYGDHEAVLADYREVLARLGERAKETP